MSKRRTHAAVTCVQRRSYQRNFQHQQCCNLKAMPFALHNIRTKIQLKILHTLFIISPRICKWNRWYKRIWLKNLNIVFFSFFLVLIKYAYFLRVCYKHSYMCTFIFLATRVPVRMVHWRKSEWKRDGKPQAEIQWKIYKLRAPVPFNSIPYHTMP